MSGIAFGKTLKYLREKARIPSKSLSMQAGKAATYVSQLERGLIKNPNYDTCYRLLELIGLEHDAIEKVLRRHGLVNRSNIFIDAVEGMSSPGPGYKGNIHKTEINSRIYDEKYRDTKDKNYSILCVLDTLADTDITRGSLVINNIYNLTQDEDNLDFLCDLFTIDYAQLSPEVKSEILVKLSRILRGSKEGPSFRIWAAKNQKPAGG